MWHFFCFSRSNDAARPEADQAHSLKEKKKIGSGIFRQTLPVGYLTYSRNIKTGRPRPRLEAVVPFFIHNNSLQ